MEETLSLIAKGQRREGIADGWDFQRECDEAEKKLLIDLEKIDKKKPLIEGLFDLIN
jgi:hypothetical protein